MSCSSSTLITIEMEVTDHLVILFCVFEIFEKHQHPKQFHHQIIKVDNVLPLLIILKRTWYGIDMRKIWICTYGHEEDLYMV